MKATPVIDNRRTAPRRPLRCPVRILTPDRKLADGRAVDVSVGGMCALLPVHLNNGDKCEVCFTTLVEGRTQTFKGTGRVAYSVLAGTDGFRTGFEFINIEPKQSSMLTRLVSEALLPLMG